MLVRLVSRLEHDPLAQQFIVIKTRLREAKGRKVKVAGTVEDLDGNVLVEAEWVSDFCGWAIFC